MHDPLRLLCLLAAFALAACRAWAGACELYPIALPIDVVDGLQPGEVAGDILRGEGPGQFGWLSWSGSPSATSLAESLEGSRAEEEYVNPVDPDDLVLEVGDWAHGRPGAPRSMRIRDALTNLLNKEIALPVWDAAAGQGRHARYRVAGFARVRLVSFNLRGEDRLTALFLGFVSCAAPNLPPSVQAGEDRVVELGTEVVLQGAVEDDGLPALGSLQYLWSFIDGPAPAGLETPESLSTRVNLPKPGRYAFALVASDGELENADSVVVQVELPNAPPVARDLAIDGLEDEDLRVFPDAEDPDGDALAILIDQRPAYGTLRYDGAAFIYAPVADFHGQDQFSYRASDGELESAAATVVVQVLPVNDAPVADALELEVEQGESLAFSLSGADIDSEGLSFEVLEEPKGGTLAANSGSYVYTPFVEFFGRDSFVYRAFDGELWSEPATATVQVTQTIFAAEANDDSYSMDEDGLLVGGLSDWLANDGSVRPELATISVERAPQHGGLELADDGTFAYRPAADFNGQDSLAYAITQAGLVSGLATVHFEVRPVNDAPWAADHAFSIPEDAMLGDWVEAMDVDGDALSYQADSMPGSGTLAMDTAGRFTYVPEPNFAGMDGFWVLVSDPAGAFARFHASIEVEPVDDPPTANPVPAFLAEDEAGPIDLGIENPDSGDEISVDFVTFPAKGRLDWQDGGYRYVPSSNAFGRDRIRFQVSDGISQSEEYEIEVWILPEPDYPVGSAEGDPVEVGLGASGRALTSVGVGSGYLQKDAVFHQAQERLLLAWQGDGMAPEEDSFHFSFHEQEGDFEFALRLDDLYTRSGGEPEGGVMARASLSPSAAFVAVACAGDGGLVIRYRLREAGAAASYRVDWMAAPQWLRVTRTGEALRLFVSEDGIHWRLLDHLQVDLGQQAVAGLYGTSSDASGFVFCEASALAWNPLQPDPFRDAYDFSELGEDDAFSDFLYDALGDSYRVESRGGSLARASDSAGFAYVEVEGDFVLAARVAGLWSEAAEGGLGLSMRGSLEAGSAQFSLLSRADGWLDAVVRASEGENAAVVDSQLGRAPVWLQLERRAGWLIGRYALEEGEWTEVGRWPDVWQPKALVGIVAASGHAEEELWALVEKVKLSQPTDEAHAAFVSQELPVYLLPGQTSLFRVEFLNTGTVPWSSQEGYSLTWAGEGESPWGLASIALPEGVVVEPGQSLMWEAPVQAPLAEGAYPTIWAMAMADGEAFGESSSLESVHVTSSPELLDTDGDGLPDLWEERYFGDLRAGGAEDSDGDGANESQEYLSGTDPTRPDNPAVELAVLSPLSR